MGIPRDRLQEASTARSPEEGAGLKSERRKAALAYVLTWLTGLIVLVVADREERYARWHAIQAIGLGITYYVVGALLGLAGTVIGVAVSGHRMWGIGPSVPRWFGLGGGLVGGLLTLAVVILVVVLAVKAYNGETVRLPVLARFADENA